MPATAVAPPLRLQGHPGSPELLARVRERACVDALLLSAPPSTRYASGLQLLTQTLLPDRPLFVVSCEAGDAVVVCNVETRQVTRESSIEQVETYAIGASPVAAVVELLEAFGLSAARIGYESRDLSSRTYCELESLLPNADLLAVDETVTLVRAVKTDDEIALMGAAFQATDRTVATVFESLTPSATPRDIAVALRTGLLHNGADEVGFVVSVGGASHALGAHSRPVSLPLRELDPVRVDFGGTFDGYQTDLARSAFMGGATAEQRDAYARLWTSLDELIASIRPGMRTRDVHASGARALERNAVPSIPGLAHVGHGIGLEVHEDPLLGPEGEHVLEPGTVLCVELIYAHGDGYALHVEDAVAITERGADILSRSRDWDQAPILG